MGNQDKIFDQIKTAAKNAETKEFPGMESVWSRVEGKLDKKVLKKENTLWKKIAVAASVLLVISLVYQYFTKEQTAVTPKNDIVISDTAKTKIPATAGVASSSEVTNPAIKENADAILEKQIATPNQIVINNTITLAPEKEGIRNDSVAFASNSKRKSNSTISNRVFTSRGVVYTDVKEMAPAAEEKGKQDAAKKEAPLIVVDDEATGLQVKDVASYDAETMEILEDPLYIINGVYYTEKELFGPNPTSPYAPLSKLKIHTIAILKDEKATAIYGEKGKKGIVIITTKTGKPTFK